MCACSLVAEMLWKCESVMEYNEMVTVYNCENKSKMYVLMILVLQRAVPSCDENSTVPDQHNCLL